MIIKVCQKVSSHISFLFVLNAKTRKEIKRKQNLAEAHPPGPILLAQAHHLPSLLSSSPRTEKLYTVEGMAAPTTCSTSSLLSSLL